MALSATTAQVINGSAPYLTINNGVNKIATTDELLAITLSDGTHITPKNNVSDKNPIVLPNKGDTLADIQMLIPVAVDSITLGELIGPPNYYWGDDDGDTVIAASGTLSIDITDNKGNKVSRNAKLDACDGPYEITLSSTESHLTTKYGMPNRRSFNSGTVAYYISPKTAPNICYVRPKLTYGTNELAGPADIWSPIKGFLVQSHSPSSYNRNFPTTGANNLYFDLDIVGVDGSALTWPTVSQGGITATMKPLPSNHNNIRVTLTGPVATTAQINSDSPGSVATPTLPQTFELVGYDSNNEVVVKYGFVLKQWFINRGEKQDIYKRQLAWCTNLGGGYRLSQIKDLTNAKCGMQQYFPCYDGIDGATPSSTNEKYYQRNIGAGLFAEWGKIADYPAAGFGYGNYRTTDWSSTSPYCVYSTDGYVYAYNPYVTNYGVCTYP